jgi:hypothetical protein
MSHKLKPCLSLLFEKKPDRNPLGESENRRFFRLSEDAAASESHSLGRIIVVEPYVVNGSCIAWRQ